MFTKIVLTLIMLLGLTLTAAADVPWVMSYQGKLTDAGGNPVPDARYDVIFTIYEAAYGGSVFWAESLQVTVEGGLFSVLLGETHPIFDPVFAPSFTHLGIKVDTDPELIPRTRLTTVPYAWRIATVDGATGGNIFGKLAVGGGHATTGDFTFAAGKTNLATGDYSSVGGGTGNSCSDWGTHIGGGYNNSAEDSCSTIAGGIDNQVTFEFGTIGGGRENIASGNYSTIAGGSRNETTNFGSTIAGGSSNSTLGQWATVGGGAANIAGNTAATVSGGISNDATGNSAMIPGGESNIASGHHSFAAGRQAEAAHNGCFVWSDASGGFFTSTADDQFLIESAGGVGINTVAPEVPLHVEGGGDVNPSGGGYFITGPITGTNLAMDNNELMARDNGVSSPLYLNNNGGNVLFNGSTAALVGIGTNAPFRILTVKQTSATDPIADAWTTYSSRRWKTNIKRIDHALDLVIKLRGVRYRWKESGQKDIGLIAEEVGEVIPEVVQYEENGVDATSVDYARLVALLIESTKEQQAMIESLQLELSQLQTTISLLNTEQEATSPPVLGQK